MTKKQKLLASIIRVHRTELLKKYRASRLGMYMSGDRLPDYDTAVDVARLAGIDVERLPYRKINL